MYTPIVDLTHTYQHDDGGNDAYLFHQIKCLTVEDALAKKKHQQEVAIMGILHISTDKTNKKLDTISGICAFRRALAKLPSHSPTTLYDAGTITCKEHQKILNRILSEKITQLLHSQLHPLLISNQPFTNWHHLHSVCNYVQHTHHSKRLAILRFTPSFDITQNSTTKPFNSTPDPDYQALLKTFGRTLRHYCIGLQVLANARTQFELAKHYDIQYLLAQEVRSIPRNMNFIDYIIDQFDHIHLSISMNVLPASIVPHLPSSKIMGIAPDYISLALKKLRYSKKVMSMEIVGLPTHVTTTSPCFTTTLASQLVAEYIMQL